MNPKVKETIEFLQHGERLALSLNPECGYFLAFSGGKDSQVLYRLAQLAEVKFTPYYSVTGIDAPANIYFIRDNYPDTIFLHAKENFFEMVKKWGMPTMLKRYCCERLKERMGAGNAVITGVRAEESRKRASYGAIEIFSRRREHVGKDRRRTIEQLERNEHQCIKGRDKLMMRPILAWTEAEVWEFIRSENLPVNPCYERHGRVGCMFCPFATRRSMMQYASQYPGFYELLLRCLRVYWERSTEHYLDSPDEYLDWWMSKETVAKYRMIKAEKLMPALF